MTTASVETAETPAETFPEYLRRVGGDHAESGMEYTAKDYTDAAERIETLEKQLSDAKRAHATAIEAAVHLQTVLDDMAQLVVQGLTADKVVEHQTLKASEAVSDGIARRIRAAAEAITACAERAASRKVLIWNEVEWRDLCAATVHLLHDGCEVTGPLGLIKLLKNREAALSTALRHAVVGR